MDGLPYQKLPFTCLILKLSRIPHMSKSPFTFCLFYYFLSILFWFYGSETHFNALFCLLCFLYCYPVDKIY
jgi:hypothetical protein